MVSASLNVAVAAWLLRSPAAQPFTARLRLCSKCAVQRGSQRFEARIRISDANGRDPAVSSDDHHVRDVADA